MRIALIHSFYESKTPSGENMVVVEQASALEAAGHSVHVVSRKTDELVSRPFYKLSSALSAANLAGPSPVSELDDFGPDLVHIHNLFPNWSSRWVREYRKAPLIATLHNFRTLCAAGTLFRDGASCHDCLGGSTLSAVRHKCYRDSHLATAPLAWASRSAGRHQPVLHNVNRLVVLNEAARQTVQDATPVPVSVCPNFVADSGVREKSRRAGWLYCGRFTEEKGVLWLAENWPRSLALTLVGEGPLGQELRLIAEHRPNLNVLGKRHRSKILDLMRASVGLVLPSRWAEGLPTVALEALSVGLPVLASKECAAASDLTRNNSGRIFDFAPACLSMAIADIEEGGEGMRERAREVYDHHYSQSSWVDRIQNIYNDVLDVR